MDLLTETIATFIHSDPKSTLITARLSTNWDAAATSNTNNRYFIFYLKKKIIYIFYYYVK